MKTGFDAYWIYVSTKIHFDGKYDLFERGLPTKDKFLNRWNEVRVEQDGKLFATINNEFTKRKVLLYLFSIYFFQTGTAYPADIMNDEYKIYKTLKDDLDNIEEYFIDDVITLIEKVSVRTKGLIDQQGPEIRQHIYNQILTSAEDYRVDGLITLAWPALLTMAQKPA